MLDVEEGRKLSQAVCVTCHLYPEPDVLDKVTWAMSCLPSMGEWLGMTDEPISERGLHPRVVEKGLFPSVPVLAP